MTDKGEPLDFTPAFLDIGKAIADIPDDVVRHLSFVLNPTRSAVSGESIGGSKPDVDEDGFPLLAGLTDYTSFHVLQTRCWSKFVRNPQINSYVRDYTGNLTGFGFEFSSHVVEINDVIETISEDPRNSLIINMTKYVARAEIEGELFLPLTLHRDGFVEVDFADPSSLKGGGDKNSGIIFHPKKPTMPLLYLFEVASSMGSEIHAYPSIYMAYYPNLWGQISRHKSLQGKKIVYPKKSGRPYSKLGGFGSFIVSWDKGYLTPRNVSHIRTTLEWLQFYEDLKKYEIDHKKSSGAYLWVIEFDDMKAFRTWIGLSETERAACGLMEAKTPGGTLAVPPGTKVSCINPQLASISGTDTDIMRMAVAGLNRPEDMVTNVSSGSTFAGIKASRGPQADRTMDEIAYFDRFLIFEFWRAIFFLHSMATDFPTLFRQKEVIGFDDKKEPLTRWTKKPPHKLISIGFPTSEISDAEGTAKGLLGVKHGSVVDSLGIPRENVARKMGFSGYRRLRYRAAEEEMELPKLILTEDDDSIQEKKLEPKKTVKKDEKGSNSKGDQ
jgi:hypothetical protein